MTVASVDESALGPGPGDRVRALPAVLAVVAAAALLPRLAGVLAGGGLFGHLGYDGGVYYGAAAGLAGGQVPYRDFLLLHPPGIMLLLAPFAELGRLTGDPIGLAVARLSWMVMGAASAVLAALNFRRYGSAAMLAAGFAYAVFLPAIRVERTTTLEAPGSLCVLGAIALITWRPVQRTQALTTAALAGCLLGMAASVKIWGVVFGLVVVLWCLAARRRQDALVVLGGIAATLIAVCLPFFVAAPSAMWSMVVADQTGRRRPGWAITERLLDIAGLPGWQHTSPHAVVAVMAVLLLGASVLAWRVPAGQLGVLLLGVGIMLLLLTPPWSLDYAALVGPFVATIVGAATAVLTDSAGLRQRLVAAALVFASLLVYVLATGPGKPFGQAFPGRALARELGPMPGCVTTDDPSLLILSDVLQRNLDRRCPFVIDLGGYSYHLQPSASLHLRRPKNRQWQHFVVDYLGSGRATVPVRFVGGTALSETTRRVIHSWPVVGHVGPYTIRRPS